MTSSKRRHRRAWGLIGRADRLQAKTYTVRWSRQVVAAAVGGSSPCRLCLRHRMVNVTTSSANNTATPMTMYHIMFVGAAVGTLTFAGGGDGQGRARTRCRVDLVQVGLERDERPALVDRGV